MKKWVLQFLSENLFSKLVSLLISLVLWFTILGRRDFVHTKLIEVELFPSGQYVVTQQSTDHVRVRVSGPRNAIKKFIEGSSSQTLVLDVSDKTEGPLSVEVPAHKIDTPMGIKILSVKPELIKAVLVKKE